MRTMPVATVLLFVIVLLLPRASAAQSTTCGADAYLAHNSTIGNRSAQGSTTRGSCTSSLFVDMRFSAGTDMAFCSHSYDPQTDMCSAHSPGPNGNAVTTIGSDGCGPATAYSYHRYVIAGTVYTRTDWSPKSLGVHGGPCDTQYDEATCYTYSWNWNTEFGYGFCEGPSPILLSLKKNAKVRLTSTSDGVLFDINGDGVLDHISWTAGNSEVAFLAVDRNNNGSIDDGTELFGNFTYPGVGNGYAALERMQRETKGTGWDAITSRDPLFSRLLLWTDRNHNGGSESAELQPASDVLSVVGLGYQKLDHEDRHGNRFMFKGFVHLRTGLGNNAVKDKKDDHERRRDTYDVFFRYAR